MEVTIKGSIASKSYLGKASNGSSNKGVAIDHERKKDV